MRYYLLIIFLLLSPIFVYAQEIIDTDNDNDGISNYEELNTYYTDPDKADTDGDSYDDKVEIDTKYSPHLGDKKRLLDSDLDKDGLNDAWELILGTDLNKTDTDDDGFSDGQEVMSGYDPRDIEPKKIDKTIKVSLAKQELEYYFGDKLFDSFLISSGLKSMPTPKGQFKVLKKVPVKHYGGVGYDLPNTKWNLHFTTKTYGYYIHGAYWHNNFGHPMSHGCVNVAYKNMEALYNWAQVGTKVIIE